MRPPRPSVMIASTSGPLARTNVARTAARAAIVRILEHLPDASLAVDATAHLHTRADRLTVEFRRLLRELLAAAVASLRTMTAAADLKLLASGKVREGRQAEYDPAWVLTKLRALARYESQATHPRACKFFLDGLDEWLGE